MYLLIYSVQFTTFSSPRQVRAADTKVCDGALTAFRYIYNCICVSIYLRAFIYLYSEYETNRILIATPGTRGRHKSVRRRAHRIPQLDYTQRDFGTHRSTDTNIHT